MPKTSSPLIFALIFFLVVHAWIAFGFQPSQTDTRLYALYAFVFDSAQRTGRPPYDHYEALRRQLGPGVAGAALRADEVTIEYPPLALAMLRVPLAFVPRSASGARGSSPNDPADWIRGFRRIYFLVHAALVVAAALWLRRRGTACSFGLAVATVAGVVMLYVLYDRLDLCLGLALLAALGALMSGHGYLGSALLAVAVNLKLVPVFLLPLFVLGALPAAALSEGLTGRRSLRAGAGALACFAGALLAGFLPFRLRWGPRVFDFLTYHGERGLQLESSWSSILLVASWLGYPARLAHIFKADEIQGPGTAGLAKVSVVVVLALLFVVYRCLWRALRQASAAVEVERPSPATLAERNPQLFLWAACALLAVAMAGAKVFSPQYLCWFLPLLLLVERPAHARDAVAILAFLLACVLTTGVYPLLWDEAVQATMQNGQVVLRLPTVRVTLLMLARNAVWIAFCVLAVARLRASRPVAEAATSARRPAARQRRRRRGR